MLVGLSSAAQTLFRLRDPLTVFTICDSLFTMCESLFTICDFVFTMCESLFTIIANLPCSRCAN